MNHVQAAKSVVMCFSGGLDSTVLLYHLRADPSIERVRCLSVNYGQRHSRELLAATEIARLAGVEHKIIDLRSVQQLMLGSSQTDSAVEVPEGHYAQENMKLTVVPNRNMILMALAAAWAISTKSDYIAIGAHAGDHAIYPDCREGFMQGMSATLSVCDYHPVQLWRPFIHWNKTQIATRGWDLRAPLHLSWTCYKGGEKHCGRCGSCSERKESFRDSHVKDPTEYEDSTGAYKGISD